MQIVVISLRDAASRRSAVLKELDSVGVDFEFFDAISGERASETRSQALDVHTFRLNTQRNPISNELGCYASHRGVWQLAVDRGQPLIVLEDDFTTLPPFMRALPVLDRLMYEYEFVRLESLQRRHRAPLKRVRPIAYRLRNIRGFELLYVSDVPTCLTGYAISPRGAERLLRASRTIVAPIDKFVQRTWEHGVPVHALRPAIVTPALQHGGSTIGARKHLKQRNPRLLLARSLYKIRGEIQRLRFDREQLARAMPARLRDVR